MRGYRYQSVKDAYEDNPEVKIQVRPESQGRYTAEWSDLEPGEVPEWIEGLEYRIKEGS